jgi:hypothetical protein
MATRQEKLQKNWAFRPPKSVQLLKQCENATIGHLGREGTIPILYTSETNSFGDGYAKTHLEAPKNNNSAGSDGKDDLEELKSLIDADTTFAFTAALGRLDDLTMELVSAIRCKYKDVDEYLYALEESYYSSELSFVEQVKALTQEVDDFLGFAEQFRKAV